MVINYLFRHGSLLTRIGVSLVIQAMIFGLTVSLAVIDTSSWKEMFFWVTMMSAAVINMANGVYQGCVYGSAAKLKMKYTNAVTIGMNISGTLSAVLMIISISLSPQYKVSAIYFFSSAICYLLFCLLTLLILRKNVRSSNLNQIKTKFN